MRFCPVIVPACGLATACGSSFNGQPSDAYAALQYLSRHAFVAPERVAVLGNSMGGRRSLGNRRPRRGTAL
jgi:dienelactone hydrolase